MKIQILVLILLLAGHGMHAALPKEEHWIGYNNPFDDQFDGEIQFRDDSILDSCKSFFFNNPNKHGNNGGLFQQAINHKDECASTFLLRAVIVNDIEAVARLIEFGADVNIQNIYGTTPLFCAVMFKEDEIIKLLLADSIDVNRQNIYGETPLYKAVSNNSENIIQLLVARGADINLQNKYNETPLHSAVKNNELETIRLLLDAGADTEITDDNNKIAIQLTTNPLIYAIFDEAVRSRNVSLKRNNNNESDCLHSKKPRF